ncbi:hypothetical protein [Nostoc punctiforme]|uniref:Uncharacterized protein n=2 Tax=Nostoc punctiforme TaxID=272131 RepID=B2ITC2_NOSP7|nr:hypothetical protein [Nostoc punctiforme]ACC81153.1 hypothetical protein Npun_R2599 [Nostoc punctiforme PCC 73102]RCJ29205.1 hypothetical protein A6769_36020 [Nostoc punctiforme NIES-2108]
MSQKLTGITEGTHVLYVLPDGRNKGEIRPAIIVKLWRDVSPELIAQGYSNLIVFIDGTNDYPDADGHTVWATSKVYSEDKEPGTWHRRLAVGAIAVGLGSIVN